jgi:hypothetical protein
MWNLANQIENQCCKPCFKITTKKNEGMQSQAKDKIEGLAFNCTKINHGNSKEVP